MKQRMTLKLIALCLCAVFLLGGCGIIDLGGLWGEWVSFSDMQYQRPDMTAYSQAADAVDQALEEEVSPEELLSRVYSFYGVYHGFYTNYYLATIHYYRNMTDLYWEEEYNYCLTAATQADARLDQLLYALAASPHLETLESEEHFGPGFFDAYQGESLWDDTFTSLMEQEAQLLSRYHELSAQGLSLDPYSEEFYTVCGNEMASLYVELVALRQKIASAAGYSDYPSFAYGYYYDRDYSCQQAEELMQQVQSELSSLYRQLGQSDIWYYASRSCTTTATFRYVEDFANAMGGRVQEAFSLLKKAGLYDIDYSENKFGGSFEVFLLSYAQPFVFVSPSKTPFDKLTFSHEFGHFCNDYASGGAIAGIDVAEVFSQAMEYLGLCYSPNEAQLLQLKMADCLCLYVEQSAYASFEHQVYRLTESDLTVEAVQQLYAQTCQNFGTDLWDPDPRSFVLVDHFFSNPLYIISYVVSNDAAFQLYQKEAANPGEGLAVLQAHLDTGEAHFLSFLESAGLSSPFLPGRMAEVRKTLESLLE